jgi:hypothetical protein
MITVDNKILTAFGKYASTNDARFYCNCLYFSGNKVVVTDAVTLIEAPATNDSDAVLLKTDAARAHATTTTAKKATVTLIDAAEEETLLSKFPPADAAFPVNPQEIAEYDIDRLIDLLTTIKRSVHEKRPLVKLSVDGSQPATRPLMLTCCDIRALIMPRRF